MNRTLGRRVLPLVAAVTCAVSATTAVAQDRPSDVRTVFVDGYGSVTFDLAALGRAEQRIREAAPADRGAVLDSLDPGLAAVAIFDLSYISAEEVERGLASVIPGPCYETFDCDKGVPAPADNEPPADPPSIEIPPPPPVPTCYAREDSRKATFGVFFKSTAYVFHQRVEYCVLGQLIQPGYFTYAWYSNIDILWDCIVDQFTPMNITTTIGPNVVHAHSNGKCSYGFQLSSEIETRLGNARPSISDSYGVDGSRISRAGHAY